MKKLILIWFLAVVSVAMVETLQASQKLNDTRRQAVRFERRNLGGPRFGMTWIPGSNALVDRLNDRDAGNVLSQFGWHFEQQVIPEGGGPQLVIQTVPLIAGVEYGRLIPSATLLIGIRFMNGLELGLGPNVMITGLESSDDIETAIVFGFGKSIDYGGVSIPLNIAVANSPQGTRISFILGYAIASGSDF